MYRFDFCTENLKYKIKWNSKNGNEKINNGKNWKNEEKECETKACENRMK